MSRDWILFLEDIQTSCAKILRYVKGLTRDQVFTDEMRFDAVLHNFHVLGEAVKNLPLPLRERYDDVPWREIAGMRDLVAHAYFALDLDILWDAIERDVPKLMEQVEAILRQEKEDGS